eukprot:XP_017951921.1 PREDICTED: vomeronasal type-2 receptor 26-like [Xenopus tropicalis]
MLNLLHFFAFFHTAAAQEIIIIRQNPSDQIKYATPCVRTHILDDAPIYIESEDDTIFKVDQHIVDGDLILGGILAVPSNVGIDLFLLSGWPVALAFDLVTLTNKWQVLTFAFAIDEINKREDLLPNITLGFEIYDSGISGTGTIERTFRILSGNRKLIPNYNCRKQEKILALIGHFAPSCSHAMDDVLSLYKYPQIMYGAKGPVFKVVVALLQYFEWKWVGIITYSEEKFQSLSKRTNKEIIQIGYCVEFFTVLTYGKEVFETEKIQKYRANVIIIFCYLAEVTKVISSFLKSNGKVFIIITEEETLSFEYTLRSYHPLNGSLWFSTHKEDIPVLEGFIQSASPTALPGNTFLDEIWKNNNFSDSSVLTYYQEEIDIDMNLLHNIHTAVYTAAHALHSLLFKSYRTENRNEQTVQNFISWQLMVPLTDSYKKSRSSFCYTDLLHPTTLLIYHLKKVSFKIPGGNTIYFDEEGNVPGYFDIWNGVILPNGTFVYVHVGTFDSSAPQGKKLKLNGSKIQWHPDFTQIPKSFCSESCSPGYRRAVRQGQVCCYDCVLCPKGEITNLSDMNNCLKCNEDQWTDERRDKCIQRETEYLSFHDYLGMSFLSSLLFIGRPRNVTCLVRQVTFGVIFATALSTIIGKTITVIIAFSATKPGSKLAKWMKTQITYRIVLLLTNGQVVICLFWLICSPPFPDTDTKSKTGQIILLCNEGSVVAFYIMIGYIGILAIVSFLLAYYARRLPDSFNESQLITFSMLVFCSVWVSFIPAYINTKGRSVVAVEVFAILTSNAGLLGFIFFPKCYIILIRPQLNNKENLMRKTKI